MENSEILSPLSNGALEMFKQEQKLRPETRGICACGHSKTHHSQACNGDWLCKPGRASCMCRVAEVVLVADNMRLFMYMTTGPGTAHALGRGILACMARDVKFQWFGKIPEPACGFCQQPTGEPIPVSIELNAGAGDEPIVQVVNRPAKINKIACPDCYDKLR